MNILMAILAMIFKAIFPVILEKWQDTSEDGSGKDIESWRETISESGWTDAAIAATDPKEK